VRGTAVVELCGYAHVSHHPPIGHLGMDDREANYAHFVRTRTHALLRSAYLLTGDQHLAEDLVQEALARTHRAWLRLERPENAEAYARKVMYHAQVSLWRRPKVAEVLPGEITEGPPGDDLAEAAVQRLALRRALLSLSAKQRAVVVLRYFEDHTEAEAAQLLGISVSTVKTQTARALERLRTLLPDLRVLTSSPGRNPEQPR
jgi:RNA polymerase sigma-70 factor (sigma-E family)